MDENVITLVVDENSRTITIPKCGTVFGVAGDIEVNRVIFSMARYFRGFDMSEFVARVNYVNAVGVANYYECDDLTSTEDNISFTWLFTRDVTEFVGGVKFSITLYKKLGADIVKRFNSKPSVGRVLYGLAAENQVTPEQQKTLLEKIETDIKISLRDYIDTAKGDINKLRDSAVTDIDNKKNRAIDAVNSKKNSAITDVDMAKDSAVSSINSESENKVDEIVTKAKRNIDSYVIEKESQLKGETGNTYFAGFKVVGGKLMMYSDPTMDKVQFYREGSRLKYRLEL